MPATSATAPIAAAGRLMATCLKAALLDEVDGDEEVPVGVATPEGAETSIVLRPGSVRNVSKDLWVRIARIYGGAYH
jgi:hypothetical protein